jgi:hypothetical protein
MTTLDAFLTDCGLADGCLVEDAVIRSGLSGNVCELMKRFVSPRFAANSGG